MTLPDTAGCIGRELPGVITVAPTQPEAEAYLRDALNEYVSACVERGEPIPVRVATADDVELVS
jgi:predicted RNase H-like HicB family nuclease